jgi:hypothetical protein
MRPKKEWGEWSARALQVAVEAWDGFCFFQ